jgi:Na+/proline symporter/CheY-like chemotaxis protein
VFDSGLLLLLSFAYLAILFLVAWAGDRRPLYPTHGWLRPHVYGLALAVYCTSWTYYGAVGSAASVGLPYLAIYLGPILLYVAFGGMVRRVVAITHERKITSIADFIASRYGKSQRLAALVTVMALVAAVPYIALQFRAVSMSLEVMTGAATIGSGPWLADGALYVALLLALFAILFGTRAIDATEHHHGLMLAIALESLVKLVAFVAIGLYAWRLLDGAPPVDPAPRPPLDGGDALTAMFLSQVLLAFLAALVLPRQFQVGAVECEDVRDVRTARVVFPLYLAVFSLLALPIASAGLALAPGDVHPDRYLLWLPLAHGAEALALLVFLGGFSAATGMVIVESVALATMVSNELVIPALARFRRIGQGADLSRLVLWVRRAAILLLLLAAFAYYRVSAGFPSLASVGLVAFVAVAQFAPPLIAGLYSRGVTAQAATAGLLAGFAVWIYTLFLPTLATIPFIAEWIVQGPAGIAWLRPHALFGIDQFDTITHGTIWSLAANGVVMWLASARRRPSVEERLRARAFLEPALPIAASDARLADRASVADLADLAARIVGGAAVQRALDDYAAQTGRPVAREALAERGLVQRVERLLAGAIGAASARMMLVGALRGTGMEIDEVAVLLDEASQELRFSRGLLGVTFENISHGISVVDRELRLVAWNRRYAELFDYPPELLEVGRPIEALLRHNAARGLLGEGDVEALVNARLDRLRNAMPYRFVRERPDGRLIETEGRPLPGGGYVTMFSDVTEYKRAERELREAGERLEARVAERTRELSQALLEKERAQREAEAANLEKTRILAAAGHDLLQPLNAARLFSSALRDEARRDPELAALAERVDSSLRAAEELIDGLLDLSRLDAGRMRPEISAFRGDELVESLSAQFAPLAATRGLDFRTRCPPCAFRSDRRLLRRILQNLLGNALRYTARGGVLIAVQRRGERWRISVVDTGPGISETQQQAIFGEFRRLDRASPWGEQGLGLGLSICERMARLLGHPLALASRIGRGSRFSIDVPAEPLAGAPAASAVAEVVPSSASKVRGLRALCIDNDLSILYGMQALLARWGVDVRIAAEPDVARAQVASGDFDVVLADHQLDAEVDGLTLLDEFAGSHPAMRRVLVTGDTSETLAAAAASRGIPMLRKPVKPAALRALLESFAAAAPGSPPGGA